MKYDQMVDNMKIRYCGACIVIIKLLLFMLFSGIIICTTSLSAADSVTTVFLVRHAEKANSKDKDPSLSVDGIKRSMELKRILEKVKLDAIYSTHFRRTLSTAKPVAESKRIEITIDKSFTIAQMKEFVGSIRRKHQGKKILIVGHSNTVPIFAKLLTGEKVDPKKIEYIDESQFDNLFIVTVPKSGKGTVINLKY